MNEEKKFLLEVSNADRITELEKDLEKEVNSTSIGMNNRMIESSKLKEQFEEHLHGEYILREILREFFKWMYKYEGLPQYFMDKLDGEKEVAEPKLLERCYNCPYGFNPNKHYHVEKEDLLEILTLLSDWDPLYYKLEIWKEKYLEDKL